GVSMTYIASYRDWDSHRNQDIDFDKIDIAYLDNYEVGFRNTSQELRFHGVAGRLDWLVGAYYGHEDLNEEYRIKTGVDTNTYINDLTLGAPLPGGPYQFFNIVPGVPSFFKQASPLLAGSYLAQSPANSGQQLDVWRVATDYMSLFTHNQIA